MHTKLVPSRIPAHILGFEPRIFSEQPDSHQLLDKLLVGSKSGEKPASAAGIDGKIVVIRIGTNGEQRTDQIPIQTAVGRSVELETEDVDCLSLIIK